MKFSVLSSSVQSRTIDVSTDANPVSYNHQRKLFYDGTYYWAFYFDGANSVYTYSADGLTWENGASSIFTVSAVAHPSVWYHDTGTAKIVYAVGDDTTANDHQLYVRRGTISGTTITWGATVTVVFALQASLPGMIPFIAKDSNGFLWIISNDAPTSATDNVGVVKSNAADNVSAWGSVTNLMSPSISVNNIFPTILPQSGGDMYAVWYANGNVNGRKYTASNATWWNTVETIATTTSGVSTKIPSAVVDSTDAVHVAYIDSGGAVLYKKRTSSWGTATTIDSSSGSTSPTITIVSANNSLYVFWISSTQQIKGAQYAGSWTNITLIETSTIQKSYLTSPYSYSSGSVSFLWGQGGSSPYEIKIEHIPEFQDLLLPIGLTVVLVVWLARRRRNPAVSGD